MILHKELMKFGLSESESKAYTALLGLREARASEIAKLSSIPRNKIYDIMEGLHKKGFAEIVPEKVMRFRAVPFGSALLLLLEEKGRHLDELAKAGQKMANQLKNVSIRRKPETGEFTVYKSRRLIRKKLEEMLQQARESIFLCVDTTDLKRLHFLSGSMHAGIKIITRIDSCTKAVAKKWSAFSAVRHTENIPSDRIAIIDNKEAFVFHGTSPVALYSSDQSFVTLMKNLADMLWNSSLSSKDRIAWLETGKPVEETKYVHGRENLYKLVRELFRSAEKDVIIATTANGAIRINRYLRDALKETTERGVKIRLLTVVNKSNADILGNSFIEIRHTERIYSVLNCFDSSKLVLVQINDDSPTMDSPDDVAIITNQLPTVSTFRAILETLWEHAKPLGSRIHEVQTGRPIEEVRFIREESSVYEATKELSSTAKKEICNISTEGSPERAVRFGTLDTDIDRARNGVRLRYMYPITGNNVGLVKEVMKFAEVRHVDATPIRVRIVDDESCLLRHTEEEFVNEKFCIFSQARYFVSAMKMFYEKMWAGAMPAEQRIRQLESGEAEIEEAKKIISRFREQSVEESFL